MWCRLAGVTPFSTAAEPCESLLARLREPHRRYHTAVHVARVVRHLADLEAAEAPAIAADGADMGAVRWAALYHDAVYDPTRADNEAVSATLAERDAMAVGWPASRCTDVHRLVMATAHHRPERLDEMLLVDADLAILGASPADYQAYVNGVRAEYQHVGDDAWRTGRAAVLRHLSATAPLFHTASMRAAREHRAHANITAELAGLERR